MLNLLLSILNPVILAKSFKSNITVCYSLLIFLLDVLLSDDGTYYFDEKHVGALGHQSPLSASASVVRGITAVAAVTSENLNVCLIISTFQILGIPCVTWFSCKLYLLLHINLDFNLQLPGDKILGLAKFFLGVGIPGSAQDLYHQIDALSCLENIRQVFLKLTFFRLSFIQ